MVNALVGDYQAWTSATTNSYWSIETTGQSFGGTGEKRSTSTMAHKNNYVSWDFEDIWTIDTQEDQETIVSDILNENLNDK